MANWIVAYRNKTSHEIVGPLWFFDEVKRKPTLWAKNHCYDGCEYTIMSGQGYDYDTGVPESILQALPWKAIPTNADHRQSERLAAKKSVGKQFRGSLPTLDHVPRATRKVRISQAR